MLRVGRISVTVDQAAANRVAREHGLVLVTDMCRRILNRGTILTPVRFGNLRAHNKIRAARIAAPGARGEVYNDAKYAAPVHDGAAPHVIRPRKKKALKFVYKGKTVIVKSVRHPGNRARPWLARAAQECARQDGWTWTPGR